MTTPGGWGAGPWGWTPWGGGPFTDDLALVSALAVRENVVRLTFSAAPNFTGILDPHDASSRFRYVVTPVAGTSGMDGLPTRPVTPVSVAQAAVPGSQGTMLDVTVDRPFSPYASQYRVTANNLFLSDGTPLDPTQASAVFYGLQRERVPAQEQNAVRTRDIANPFNAAALSGNLLVNNLLTAGTFSPDATGDLALDEGVITLKKWILRVCLCAVGGFPHIPKFGVGLVQAIKRLNTATARTRLATSAQQQIAAHPLVVKSAVVFQTVKPGFVRMQVLARTKTGAGIKVEQVFQVSF
jgi:hypothetical protein